MIDLSFTLSDLELFLLVLVRVTCFLFVAPFYSTTGVPARVKVVLGIFVAYLIYSILPPQTLVSYESPLEYGIVVLKEAVVGLLVGLGAYICVTITGFAGRMIDTEIGLSMASIMDNTTRESSSLTGVFLNYLILLILIISGMYQYILKALAETYQLIPVNGANFSTSGILNAFISFMGDFFSIGFRICLPVMASIMILNGVLGVLARVAPQLNMFVVGLQLKILAGLGIFFVTIGVLPYASDFIYKEMKIMIVSLVEAMI